MEHLRDLRLGRYQCLVGVNLLREGLDLPEVSLVAILDADKQGFLRSETSLIQTIGRSARNANAKVILYGDKVTAAMKSAIHETARRRSIQEAYNQQHGITPQTVFKPIQSGITTDLKRREEQIESATKSEDTVYITQEYVDELRTEMLKAAEDLEFERAGMLRDRIGEVENAIGQPMSDVDNAKPKGRKGRRRRKGGKVPRPKKKL